MNIVLIRHGATEGNIKKRYIGVTDEVLCASGIEGIYNSIKAGYYPKVQAVFVSPMKRCRQTAKLIYPEYEQQLVMDFRECDFGMFEGKNYKELSGNEQYQRWIDSNATIPFPDGEDIAEFKKRSVNGWYDMIKRCQLLNYSDIACVVHGGTIMAVLSEIYGGGYYDYHCGNGDGYICDVTSEGRIKHISELMRQE